MAIRVGIMGFGRIGRNFFRQAWQRDDIDIVAISDLGTPESMAYLLEYDTVYGRFEGDLALEGRYLVAGRQKSRLLRGVTPQAMPWDALGVDLVVEATGNYRHAAELNDHLLSGARRVVLTTPALDEIDRTIVHGINEHHLLASDHIVSCASTSTHALALTLKILDEALGVERGFMTMVHAYTSDQRLADTLTDDLRLSRSAAENLIPNQTWVPALVGEKLIPGLAGKIEGMVLGTPVHNGSNIDLVCQLRGDDITAERVNHAFRQAADGPLSHVVACVEEPIVSSDVIGHDSSAVFDTLATLVLPGGLVKTLTWYDNGWGYTRRILDTVVAMGAFMREEVA